MTSPKDTTPFKRSALRSETKVRALSASDLGLQVTAPTLQTLGQETVTNMPDIHADAASATRQVPLRPISIFPPGPFVRDEKLCFVLMPFKPELQDTYDYIIRPAVEALTLECRRADDITQQGNVLAQIYRSLMEARIVIADLTGTNGNVLYELGLAHMMGHQAILLTQTMEHVPFDLRHERHILYSLAPAGVVKAKDSLMKTLTASLQETSPTGV